MRLYDPGDGRTLLTRRVGVMTWADGVWTARLHEPVFALPDGLAPTTATFGDAGDPLIALPGYRLARDGDILRLTLVWQAAAAPGDFTRFVHLLDARGAIIAPIDGAYRLAVGFYAPTEGLPRLSAADASGPLPDGRFLLPQVAAVE